MSDLQIVPLPNGQFVENCYLVADTRSGDAVMIDPGQEPHRFLAELQRHRWHLRAIWLTHAHVDHVMGVGAVHQATGAPIHLHPADRFLYDASYRTFEGLQLDLDGYREGTAAWIRVHASVDPDTAKRFASKGPEVKAPDPATEAAAINARAQAFDFQIPVYQYDQIYRPLQDLLAPPAQIPAGH